MRFGRNLNFILLMRRCFCSKKQEFAKISNFSPLKEHWPKNSDETADFFSPFAGLQQLEIVWKLTMSAAIVWRLAP